MDYMAATRHCARPAQALHPRHDNRDRGLTARIPAGHGHVGKPTRPSPAVRATRWAGLPQDNHNRLQKLPTASATEIRMSLLSRVASSRFRPSMEVRTRRHRGPRLARQATLLLDPPGVRTTSSARSRTDLPLPPDSPGGDHCGDCRPASTPAPPAPSSRRHRLDARRCISTTIS